MTSIIIIIFTITITIIIIIIIIKKGDLFECKRRSRRFVVLSRRFGGTRRNLVKIQNHDHDCGEDGDDDDDGNV